MFKKNTTDNQEEIFFSDSTSTVSFFSQADGTKEDFFYKLIYCNIDESLFKDLYANNFGRPNAPINAMVSALILKETENWTINELFDELKCNILKRRCIGFFGVEELSFSRATLYNFINKLNTHAMDTGISLIDEVFFSLTQTQLKDIKVNTSICRTDSIMVNSNIKKYGRLELLLTIVQRLYRIFSPEDKEKFNVKFNKYNAYKANKYVYQLKGSDLSKEFPEICKMYYWIDFNLIKNYSEKQEYINFKRVLSEQFCFTKGKLTIKVSGKVGSSSLQSPDDVEATYRTKRGDNYHGFVASVTETVSSKKITPNLIVDIGVASNNTDDSTLLENSIEAICEIVPDIEEIHYDGGYGSDTNDEKLLEKGILGIQTAIRGRKCKVEIAIKKVGKTFEVTCQNNQKARVKKTKKRFKACFELNICNSCPYLNDCPTKIAKNKRVLYFDTAYFNRKQRHLAIERIPKERRQLRNNVEATMHEFSHKMRNHKTKVRGLFKTRLFIITAAIGINFGRIYRYWVSLGKNTGILFSQNILVIFWREEQYIHSALNLFMRQTAA